jgi:hypothetical protein
LRGAQPNFLDGFAAFRDWEIQNPDEAANYLQELGQIPEHATEMRAAANFLVANYGRQKIVTMPRSVPKIAIFEEAAGTLEIPGGVRMIQEYYRQMRKFGCNILAVVQQYDVLKTSEVRGAMIGNSKIFLRLKSPSALKMLARSFSDLAWMG